MPETEKGPAQASGGPGLADKERRLVGELRRLHAEERSVEDELLEIQSEHLELPHKPNGAAAAAVFSASLGVFAIGLLTTLAAASTAINNWLNWYHPTGPLSGKTTLGSIVWLVAWLASHLVLRNRETNFARTVKVSAALIAGGLLLTFPPFFDIFH